jgi:hypothetical protein
MDLGPFPLKPSRSNLAPPSLRKQCNGCIAWYITLHPVYHSPSFSHFFPAIRQFNVTMADLTTSRQASTAFWREKKIKFYFRTKRHTRKNSSLS